MRDLGSIPGLGRSPGGGHGNPLQYSCLENPMDRGAWQVTVQRVAQSQTRLKQLGTAMKYTIHSNTKKAKKKVTWSEDSVSHHQSFYMGVRVMVASLVSYFSKEKINP